MSPVIEGGLEYQIAGAPSNGINEVQTLTIGGTPTGGTFKLAYDGQVTAAITWSATNNTLLANIQTALRALENIGASDVTVTNSTLSSGIGNCLITFGGNLAKLAVNAISVYLNSLTGTVPTLAIAETVVGVTATARGAAPGAELTDTTNGNLYRNDGTALEPIWNSRSGFATLEIHVNPSGSDTSGEGSILEPVKTLTKAMTLVSATRMVIRLASGSYAEAAPVVWPTRKGVSLIGPGSQFCSISAVGTSVFTVTPGVQTSTFTGYMQGFEIDHSAGAAQSGITFNNTGMTKKLNFYTHDVPFSADDPTDKSIDVKTHTDADNAIRIYMTGDGTQKEIGGAIYFEVNNLADRLHCEQLWLVGTITTPNVAKEMRIRLFRCIVPHAAALAGGNATQVVTAVECHSWIDYNDITPEVYAALDTAELTGSHSEVIVA